MRCDGRRRPGEIDIVRIRIAGKALDVVCVCKRVLFFGRSMTSHAVEPEACIRIREWRIVIVDTLRIPDFGPVPTVLRTLAVFDHDGPTTDFLWWLELVPGGWRRILFLYDHRAVFDHLSGVLT